jgi:hypothetical protein
MNGSVRRRGSRAVQKASSPLVSRTHLLRASKDHAEPELELVSEVVAGLQDVVGRHLNEVRVRVGGKLLQYRLGNFDDRVRPVCTLYDTVLY